MVDGVVDTATPVAATTIAPDISTARTGDIVLTFTTRPIPTVTYRPIIRRIRTFITPQRIPMGILTITGRGLRSPSAGIDTPIGVAIDTATTGAITTTIITTEGEAR